MNYREIAKVTVTLLVTFVCVAGVLAFVNAITSPRIEAHERAREQAATNAAGLDLLLHTVCPSAESFEKAGAWKVHERDAARYCGRKAGAPVAYIIQSYGKGYSSLISVLVVVDTSFNLQCIRVLDQQETPGLGDQVTAPEFIGQFVGRGSDQLTVSTSGAKGCIQAVSGATISSRAVAEDAVKSAVFFLKSTIGKGK